MINFVFHCCSSEMPTTVEMVSGENVPLTIVSTLTALDV